MRSNLTVNGKSYIVNSVTNASAIISGAVSFKGSFRLYHHSTMSETGKIQEKFASVSVPGKPDNVDSALRLLAAAPEVTWKIPSVSKGAQVQFKLIPTMSGERAVSLLVFRSQECAQPYSLPSAISEERYASHLLEMGLISLMVIGANGDRTAVDGKIYTDDAVDGALVSTVNSKQAAVA